MEHLDNHQRELLERLQGPPGLTVLHSLEGLAEAVAGALEGYRGEVPPPSPQRASLVEYLSRAVGGSEGARSPASLLRRGSEGGGKLGLASGRARLVREGGSLVLMVLIGRWLGPRNFGLYSYALAMTGPLRSHRLLGPGGDRRPQPCPEPRKEWKDPDRGPLHRDPGRLDRPGPPLPIPPPAEGRGGALVIVLLLGGAYLFQAWDVLDPTGSSPGSNPGTPPG